MADLSSTLTFLYASAFGGTSGAFKVRADVIADVCHIVRLTDSMVIRANRELYQSGFMVTWIGQDIVDHQHLNNPGYLVVQHVQQALTLREYSKPFDGL